MDWDLHMKVKKNKNKLRNVKSEHYFEKKKKLKVIKKNVKYYMV